MFFFCNQGKKKSGHLCFCAFSQSALNKSGIRKLTYIYTSFFPFSSARLLHPGREMYELLLE